MPALKPEDCDRLFEYYLNAGDLNHLVMLFEPLLATRPRIKLEVVKVVQTGKDLALVYNDWTLSATGADGNPIERSGKAIEVVRRQPDGSWRFAIDDPTARG
jgi:ketosteroid isomerase-like protein